MSRNADFRVDASFNAHPKIRRLYALLGSQGVLSWILLLAHASQYETDGRFSGMSDDVIALAAHYPGAAPEFIGTLIELGLLDRRGKTLSLHDWNEHNGYAASYSIRSQRARKAAGARWSKKSSDATDVSQQSRSNAQASKESSRNTQPEFETAWSLYPDRKPNNPKRKALRAWNGALSRGNTADAMIAAVERYAAYVRAEGNEGTKYVKQAATFFGDDEFLKASWIVAPARANGLVPNGKAAPELGDEYFKRQA